MRERNHTGRHAEASAWCFELFKFRVRVRVKVKVKVKAKG
jgi:hypothetical protein